MVASSVLLQPAQAQYGGYGGGGYGGGGGYDRRRGEDDDDGYRRGPPRARGSFQASCRGVEQDGATLRAMCRTTSGDYVPARIDLRRCGGAPIANVDGRLRC
ncbi:CVNH domain-containing protein [Micromonospora sp. STR1s_5]|nr:CVNH domain-containing protein [Micromonospora sp. STR1s_5]